MIHRERENFNAAVTALLAKLLNTAEAHNMCPECTLAELLARAADTAALNFPNIPVVQIVENAIVEGANARTLLSLNEKHAKMQ